MYNSNDVLGITALFKSLVPNVLALSDLGLGDLAKDGEKWTQRPI